MKRIVAVVAACVLACVAFGREITGKVTRVGDGGQTGRDRNHAGTSMYCVAPVKPAFAVLPPLLSGLLDLASDENATCPPVAKV